MAGLRDLSELFGDQINVAVVQSLTWPSGTLIGPDGLSIRRLLDRFGGAGAALRQFRTGAASSAFKAVDRASLTSAMRDRILDPAIMDQSDTKICGPIAIAFELARRQPEAYVRTIMALFEQGKVITPTGRTIEPDKDLLKGDFPAPKNGKALSQADWILGASLRDDENWFWDTDGNNVKDGLSGGITTGFEMASWSRDLLGAAVEVQPGFYPGVGLVTGEIKALRKAAKAVAAGGFAFVCINAALIQHKEKDDDEEQIGWVRTMHSPGARGAPSAWTHSDDDGVLPDHWVVLLGDLKEDGDDISVRLWSWRAEYVLSGTADSLGEYIFGVTIGR